MQLYKYFCAALNDARQVATSGYLQRLAPYIKDIESKSASYAGLGDYCKRMEALIQSQNFALTGSAINDFCQVFGEAHFLSLCHDRGVYITKVPTRKNRKTPDFAYSSSQGSHYFEVKTLSIVSGGLGINDSLESALDAQVEIERQLQSGRRAAIGESILQPYGPRPHRNRIRSAVINTLIEKSRQNIKSEQYQNPSTFLALNLFLIPPVDSDSRALRPAYCADHLSSRIVTGDLWMLAFARPEMLVHGYPEFEGFPAIEGTNQKLGILADTEFQNIAGLLVVTYPLGKEPSIYGLYRYSDYTRWRDKEAEIIRMLTNLTQKYWNDDLDSNGWQLL